MAVAQERLPRPAVSNDRYGVGFVGAHDGRGGPDLDAYLADRLSGEISRSEPGAFDV